MSLLRMFKLEEELKITVNRSSEESVALKNKYM